MIITPSANKHWGHPCPPVFLCVTELADSAMKQTRPGRPGRRSASPGTGPGPGRWRPRGSRPSIAIVIANTRDFAIVIANTRDFAPHSGGRPQ